MASMADINDQLAGIDIDAEENEELCFDGEIDEGVKKFELCLVGRFLTEKNINIRAMRSKMADIWRPAMGITIKELTTGLFLFQFYHKDDVQWVRNGGPWSFDGAMLVLNTIVVGEDPVKVPLVEVNFWIQIYDLPIGFMTESVGRQLGNFFGVFLEYDPNNNSSIWREFMHIKIKVDLRKPLKRKKKITRKNGSDFLVQCKYERLGDFCFSCGLISHTERFCQKKLDSQGENIVKEWGVWLRAPPRRMAGQGKSKWLREEGDDCWGDRYGKDNNQQHVSGNQVVTAVNVERDRWGSETDRAVIKGNFKLPTGALNKTGGNSNFGFINGPSDNELDGLDIEERKRKRYELAHIERMDTDSTSLQPKDSALSTSDCTESNNSFLATLAVQASRAL